MTIYIIINKVQAREADGSFLLPLVVNPYSKSIPPVKVAMCAWSSTPYAARSVFLGPLQKGDWIDGHAAEEITNETLKQTQNKDPKGCWSPGQLVVAATRGAVVGEEVSPKSIGKNSTPEGTYGLHHMAVQATGSYQVTQDYPNGAWLTMVLTINDTSPPPNAPMYLTGDGILWAEVKRPT